MFYDHAKIEISAGKGGNGCMSFRREKHVPRGGPDGGDGGDGGGVVFAASSRLRDLAFFQRLRHFHAENGGPGQGSRKHGRSGDDLAIEVPCGTQVLDEAGVALADLTADGQRFMAARGGAGGKGNARFVTSTRRAPRFAGLGLEGEKYQFSLKLRLLADVGLLGFPNAGKSSLLRKISRARPKVADYPFTTTSPMLGTVDAPGGHQQFTVADIPGLLEGASEGVGLGNEFLAHLARTSLLIHIVDAGGYYGKDPVENFDAINRELSGHSPELAARWQLVAVNKIDVAGAGEADEITARLAETVARMAGEGHPAFQWFSGEDGAAGGEAGAGMAAVIPISAATGHGCDELIRKVFYLLKNAWEKQPRSEEAVLEGHITYRPGSDEQWQVALEKGRYLVKGPPVERLIARTDFENEEAVAYLQERLEKLGVSDALRKAGARDGEDVVIGGVEFELW